MPGTRPAEERAGGQAGGLEPALSARSGARGGSSAVCLFRLEASGSAPQTHGAGWLDGGASGAERREPSQSGPELGRHLLRWPSPRLCPAGGGTVLGGEARPSTFRPCSLPPSLPEA